MKLWQPTALALLRARLARLRRRPPRRRPTTELLKELQALKERVDRAREASRRPPRPRPRRRGAVGHDARAGAEFNRIAVKTEALEDARDATGFKGLKISGYMDPTYIYNQRQDRAGFQFLNAVGDDGYNYDNSYFGTAVIDFEKETDSGTTLAPDAGARTAASAP